MHSTTVTLTVTSSTTPDFTLSASPTSVSTTPGHHATVTITITPLNGFTGQVFMSASGEGGGVTPGINPNPATGVCTLILAANTAPTPGTTTVTIKGVSGSLTHTTTISFTVQ